jgi:tRNA-specific 2-thiouridylase
MRKIGVSFDKFATGHYANIKFNSCANMYQLHKAVDTKKDQTYFLYRLTQKDLSEILFPLGVYTKKQVRRIAKEIGLPVAGKPESQDFYCGNYNELLQFPVHVGNIVDKNGKILGKHDGIWNYTIGKRKALGLLGGTKCPLYVIRISAKRNLIVVGPKEDLYSSSLTADKILWNSVTIPKNSIKASVKIRQQHKAADAIITYQGQGSAKIEFNKPQMSISAGQSAVFYKNNLVLGGGFIT